MANDSAGAGVTWTIASGGGSLTAVTTTSVTYAAPLPITASMAVVMAASKTTDPTKTASITIPLLAIGVNAISPAGVRLNGGGSQTFTVSVTNDTSNSGVNWNVGTGVGTLSSVTATGVTYTAPTTIGGTLPFNVTLTATSIKDPT